MKKGIRVLGIAESYKEDISTIAGVVIRKDLHIDDFCFGDISVGKLDSTKNIIKLYNNLGREDINLIMISGIALAWYNIIDLNKINEETLTPVLSVTYEESSGLSKSIKNEFEDKEKKKRLQIYNKQPERNSITLPTGRKCFVRSVGIDQKKADKIIKSFTTHGKRPEPVRVAKLAARAHYHNKSAKKNL